MLDTTEFNTDFHEKGPQADRLARVNDFRNDPFTTEVAASFYFEQWNSSAEQAIGELNKRKFVDNNYTNDDFVNELKRLYRIITAEDHVSVIEKIFQDARSNHSPTIHVIDSELGQSEMFMQRLLLSQAEKRKKLLGL